jgi:hypothetical protein
VKSATPSFGRTDTKDEDLPQFGSSRVAIVVVAPTCGTDRLDRAKYRSVSVVAHRTFAARHHTIHHTRVRFGATVATPPPEQQRIK